MEKAKENLSKQTRRGGQSLEMKKLKEEEATVEKILQMLKDGKDVRKSDWGPKEVSHIFITFCTPQFWFYMMNKSYKARHNPSSSTAASSKLTQRLFMRGSPTLTLPLTSCIYHPSPLPMPSADIDHQIEVITLSSCSQQSQ